MSGPVVSQGFPRHAVHFSLRYFMFCIVAKQYNLKLEGTRWDSEFALFARIATTRNKKRKGKCFNNGTVELLTNGHLSTTAAFLADSPFVDSCLNLSTMATFFCPKVAVVESFNCIVNSSSELSNKEIISKLRSYFSSQRSVHHTFIWP